jgi:hypothetical protein
VADDNLERDIETINPRSMAFSHIETMIKDNGGLTSSLVGSDGGNSSSAKKIDMDIIDRIKSMRSKSREHNSLIAQSQQLSSNL